MKFKYGQAVVVIGDSFFTGLKGKAVDYILVPENGKIAQHYNYLILLTDGSSKWIAESNLQVA